LRVEGGKDGVGGGSKRREGDADVLREAPSAAR
jgi:hypothetical protein